MTVEDARLGGGLTAGSSIMDPGRSGSIVINDNIMCSYFHVINILCEIEIEGQDLNI